MVKKTTTPATEGNTEKDAALTDSAAAKPESTESLPEGSAPAADAKPDESVPPVPDGKLNETSAANELEVKFMPQLRLKVLHRREYVMPGNNVRYDVYLETPQPSPLAKPPISELRLCSLSQEDAMAFDVGKEYVLTFTTAAAE